MKHAARFAVALLASALVGAAPAASGEVWRNHFDADGPSRPPAFFDLQVLGAPGKANWMVVADHNPPSTPNQLTQTIPKRPEGSIAVALRRNVTLQDGRVTVALKKLPAKAGLVLREVSENVFLALLAEHGIGRDPPDRLPRRKGDRSSPRVRRSSIATGASSSCPSPGPKCP